MDQSVMEEGVELMVIGMGVVFAFLVLLVVFMTLSGVFFRRMAHLFPEPEVPVAAPARKSSDAGAKMAVALAAAHRTRHQS